ncbi:hypothetical protein MUK42_13007 [Musa troglodytarum]|uniref:Uncharacterized protein n=1 Tax=Musa troglodytarum TaxID=320322 RepID=A0A9E7KUQ5_9LILI|nr:hypothetical protein MUK42_13007 [Musa troglodytarum]
MSPSKNRQTWNKERRNRSQRAIAGGLGKVMLRWLGRASMAVWSKKSLRATTASRILLRSSAHEKPVAPSRRRAYT